MEIVVRHSADCPNAELAVRRIRRALDSLGRAEITVRRELLPPEAPAGSPLSPGSPTILVDGRDPFPMDMTGGTRSCRLYDTEVGLSGAPSVAQLLEVLHG